MIDHIEAIKPQDKQQAKRLARIHWAIFFGIVLAFPIGFTAYDLTITPEQREALRAERVEQAKKDEQYRLRREKEDADMRAFLALMKERDAQYLADNPALVKAHAECKFEVAKAKADSFLFGDAEFMTLCMATKGYVTSSTSRYPPAERFWKSSQ